MATSQNGYPANDRRLVSSRLVPGTTRRLTVRNGPAGDLLLWVAAQFDALIEDIEQGVLDDWGYAERNIRGSTTTLSNHASGTAIDLNAVSHPLGTPPAKTFNLDRIAAIRAIIRRTNGCVRWGGDYTGRPDSMHFEIANGVSEARCAAALVAVNTPKPGAGGKPAPEPTQKTQEVTMQRRTITPPNKGENSFRVELSGTDSAAVIVRPRINAEGVAAPMWVGNIFAWGSDKAGVGGNPTLNPNYQPRLTSHRRYSLPGALWADVNYSASEAFEIDIVG